MDRGWRKKVECGDLSKGAGTSVLAGTTTGNGELLASPFMVVRRTTVAQGLTSPSLLRQPETAGSRARYLWFYVLTPDGKRLSGRPEAELKKRAGAADCATESRDGRRHARLL